MSNNSLSDILTTINNLVQGVSALAQNYLNVEGQQSFAGLTAPTVVKPSSGRIVRISVTVAGAATGTVFDGSSLNALTKPLYVIPTTVGVYLVSLPANFGIVVSPGTGQTVAGSFS